MSLKTTLVFLISLLLCFGLIESTSLQASCQLKHKPGVCRGIFKRYYFDLSTGKCKSFTWGGCGGVVPFKNEQECIQACEKKEEGQKIEKANSSSDTIKAKRTIFKRVTNWF